MIDRIPTRRTADRRAFTLIELMVTITIVIIIMSILTFASGIAADTFRRSKVEGDHVAQERTALTILGRDLQYRHFLDEDGKPNQGRRVSDQRTDMLRVDTTVTPNKLTGYKPPRSGYFFADSRPAPTTMANNPTGWLAGNDTTWNWSEGADTDGFQSSRSGNHVLQFTIIVPGGAPEDTLTADVPFQTTNPIIGRAGEVAYFLVQDGQTPGATPAGKYKLIRRHYLAALNTDDQPAYQTLLNNSGAAQSDPPEVMAAYYDTTASKFKMFHLGDLTVAANRVGGTYRTRAAITATGNRFGEDVLLSNVTSFEIKFTGPQATSVTWPSPETSTVWPRPFPGNSDYPYDNLPFDGKYDTFNQGAGWDTATNLAGRPSATSNPNSTLKPIRITGVSIRLRCWNPKSKITRQSTIKVDL